jgi:hypothetical protein
VQEDCIRGKTSQYYMAKRKKRIKLGIKKVRSELRTRSGVNGVEGKLSVAGVRRLCLAGESKVADRVSAAA